MHATDVIGWYVGENMHGPFCPDCTPSTGDDTHPIFGDSETDCPSHCEECGEYLGESLTPAGVEYVIDSLADYVNGYGGNPAVLDAWAQDLRWYSLGDAASAELRAYFEIREEESI